MPEGGERQRDAVAEGEGRDDQAEAAERAAEEQQADQEQDVVRADHDVVDAGRHERRQHRGDAGPAAGVVVHRRPPRVEDGLVPQRAVLVDVDERLVLAVVGEQRGVDRRRAPGRPAGRAAASGNRSACRSGTGVRSDSVTAAGLAVDDQPQPAGEEVGERRRVPRAPSPASSSAAASGEAELVRGVEVVDRQRAGDAAAVEPQVEEAERRRVRRGRRREQQADDGGDARARRAPAGARSRRRPRQVERLDARRRASAPAAASR